MKASLYNPSEVRKFCERYFEKLGMPSEDASTLVDVLIEADLKSISSHGILRIPHYSERLLNKTIKTNPNMSFRKIGNAAMILDANDGMGHIAAVKAIKKAIELAKENAVGVVSAINSSHFGIAGYFSEIAADNNMLGISMTHTDANTAPFGAEESYIGSNALAFSAPTNEGYHLTADFSFTKISYGKIYNAQLKGIPLPPNSAIDDEGHFTTDPEKVEHLTPAAEHKGYGMLLMIEVLCALLTGIPFCHYITDMYQEMGNPRKLGHFFMAIDISRFNDISNFRRNISKMISDIHSLKPDNLTERIHVHGEDAHYSKIDKLENGILIEDSLKEALCYLVKDLSLDFPSPIK